MQNKKSFYYILSQGNMVLLYMYYIGQTKMSHPVTIKTD